MTKGAKKVLLTPEEKSENAKKVAAKKGTAAKLGLVLESKTGPVSRGTFIPVQQEVIGRQPFHNKGKNKKKGTIQKRSAY